ncbi:hypothetical protein [Parendozoicomonas haliclonae]|uniref:Uncharacterized protein n=1 Tax=Parendozoicomonas haliclonae TaxID=1960125 RepID=A0A1X7ADY2_9GAMM|nr:hypothetical protein [Parendozoicomonas haliclonae]SMA31575.1 hypothetical protein EHSB41UT_00029 [Parendozoicomonas haliclonae]
MTDNKNVVLIIGSSPDASRVSEWSLSAFSQVVAVNNAWRICPDWTHCIFPADFPEARQPVPLANQQLITEEGFVPLQNLYGGFVYAGGTMAFTAAYWVLAALKPKVICFIGCDMVYPKAGNTHFYGNGQPDPLREDISLRSLEAKSARFSALAQRDGCQVLNLTSLEASRQVFPKISFEQLTQASDFPDLVFNQGIVDRALSQEVRLGYFVEDGEYWKCVDQFDVAEIDTLDALWLSSLEKCCK